MGKKNKNQNKDGLKPSNDQLGENASENFANEYDNKRPKGSKK